MDEYPSSSATCVKFTFLERMISFARSIFKKEAYSIIPKLQQRLNSLCSLEWLIENSLHTEAMSMPVCIFFCMNFTMSLNNW